jgi:hypothetical protein
LKFFLLILLLIFSSQATLATTPELLGLTKILAKHFNQSSPKSLVAMIDDLQEYAESEEPDDNKLFIRKAKKIITKQKSLAKSLLKLRSGSQSTVKFKDLRQNLIEFEESLSPSKEFVLTDNIIASQKLEINDQIQELMSSLETDIENAKQELLNYPNNSGVFGTTVEIYGNCMPSTGTSKSSCVSDTGSMELVIREPASIRDFDPTGALISKPELVTQVSSDEHGFFEINLNPGLYSVLVLNGETEFCTSGFSEDGLACLIKIEENSKTFYKSILDNAVW